MGLMSHLAVHLLQCQNSLCYHPGNELLLLCFYIASLWLPRFLFGWPLASRIYSTIPLWMESKALAKSTNNIVACRFFCTYTFKNSTDNQSLWRCGSIPPEAILVLPKYVLNFGFYVVALYILVAMDVRVIPR